MLTAGTHVGQYEVLEPLGAGAMGQVFRARDLKLGRFVALKTLPDQLLRDVDRLTRFAREARVLASLNHPNIATLHEVADLGDTHLLVLELVEGETLAERIARGPIPIDEALPIAAQIAAALEAAHDEGVVHRDLKPANVKMREDGAIKLLDFGLAKVLATHADGSGEAEATVTGLEPNGRGAVLGTPAYMSPEQARGLPVDKRTDVWAFGCVLYEMLTGRRAFVGEHATDVIVNVVDHDPAFDALPVDCPAAIRRLLRRCLTKDVRQRLRDLGDARLDLADAAIGLRETGAELTRFRRRTWLAAAFAAATVAAGAIWLGSAQRPSEPAAAPRIARFALPDRSTSPTGGAAMAIANDGKRIAYLGPRGLVLRSRDRLDVTLVPDTEGSTAPFFSPDGEWLAFTYWHELRKVPTAGGLVQKIADVGPSAMGAWRGDDIIVADMKGLLHVPASGGKPQRLITDLSSQEQALQPQYLAQRQAVLFTVNPSPALMPSFAANAPGARVDALDLTTGRRHVVVRGGGRARYLPTGHIVYAAGPTLYAAAFDLESLTMRGEPTAVLTGDGPLEFAVADDGTLLYQAWSAAGARELVWVDRQGREELIPAPPMSYIYPRLSPDGARVALDLNYNGDRDTFIFDLRRNTLERFTHDPASNPISAWSPDGRYIAFGSDRFGVTNLFRQAADGSSEPERLLTSTDTQMPISYAPDGRLLFSAAVPGQQRDIYVLSFDGEPHGEPLVATAANELTAEVSPDGRWIAYDSNQSGQFEVYVRAYPNTDQGGRWQISSGGGRQAVWSHDGRELFYRDFDGALMSVAVTLTPTFAPGRVTKLFQRPEYVGAGAGGSGRTYDVALDDSRFLMIKELRAAALDGGSQLVMVLDWFAELERLVPID